jgi:hypothetical protein
MSYAIKLSDLVERRLGAQPESVQQVVRAALERLAQSPTSASRRSPPAKRGQVAEIKYVDEGVSLWITFTFYYDQDEETLHIEHVVVEYGP